MNLQILQMNEIDIQLTGKGLGNIDIIGHAHINEQSSNFCFWRALGSLDFQGLGKGLIIDKTCCQEIGSKSFMPSNRLFLCGSVTHLSPRKINKRLILYLIIS